MSTVGPTPTIATCIAMNLDGTTTKPLSSKTSALGQLRLDSVALRQGEYSTRLAMTNLLAYNMTHDEQSMTVVLNGRPDTDGWV